MMIIYFSRDNYVHYFVMRLKVVILLYS